jgi:hypothetical protein
MGRTLRPAADAVGDTVSAMIALVAVSAVIARLIAEEAVVAARRAFSPRGTCR